MARSKARRVVFVIVGLTPLLAACTGILGISDFHKEECNGGVTDCVDGGLDVFVPDSSFDAKTDGPPNYVDGGGTEPVAWAKWKMPNYPQDGAVNVPSYDPVANSDAGAVKDSVSQLTWRPVASPDETNKTFSQATAFCAGLKGGAWRLPTRIELVTLLDFSQKSGATAAPVFKLTSKKYWTTSFYRTTAGQTTQRLAIGFDGANIVTPVDETESLGAICIQAQ